MMTAGHIMRRLQLLWCLPKPPQDTEERLSQMRRWIVMRKSRGSVRLMNAQYVTREELNQKKQELRSHDFLEEVRS